MAQPAALDQRRRGCLNRLRQSASDVTQRKPKQHATNAVLTARAIQRQTRALNRTAAPAEVITINIGINSGTAAVGSTRFEDLTGARWTYTASGPVTNIAARLAALATHGEIYVGEATAVRVKERFQFRALGTHHAKNIQEPLVVYAVFPDKNAE